MGSVSHIAEELVVDELLPLEFQSYGGLQVLGLSFRSHILRHVEPSESSFDLVVSLTSFDFENPVVGVQSD